MAGDWIKLEKATLDKPEVWQIAAATGIEVDAALGKLFRVWSWFDTNSKDGKVSSVSPVTLESRIDVIAGVAGFAAAMRTVGWLNGTSIPNFENHFGKSEKDRLLTNRRAQVYRDRRRVTEITGPEKRREEDSPDLRSVAGNSTIGGSVESPPASKKREATAPSTAGGAVWESYRLAYSQRYGVEPVRNAKANGICAQVAKRLPTEQAPAIAAFFLTHNNALYLRAKHALELLLRDAEGLRTEWLTGTKVTGTSALQAERTAHRGDVFGQLLTGSPDAKS